MLPMLRHAFDSAAAAKDRAARYRRADHAPLRIGLSLTVGLDAIAPKLAELARAFPGLDLHVLRAAGTAALEALKAGETELCIAADIDTEWDRVDRWPLFEEGFVLLATEPREPAMPASAEADATALIARPYCETWRRHFAQSAPGDATRRYRHEVSSEEDAALLASLGMGVALLPASIGRSLAASTATAYDSGLVRSVHVYGVAGRQRSPAANALLVLLRAADWTVPAATG
jgi:DNA-binding transcriptional LysR family regulator